MENSAFRRAVCSDSAENSIMQTITIAVSAILIASGLVTAPGLINNARDNNSRSDLANSAYAEETMLAVDGKYWAYDNYTSSEYRKLERPGIEGSVNLTVSTAPRLIVDVSDNGQKWMGTSYSSSGKVFIRSSDSAETVQVNADTFKSLAAPLAGEEVVIDGANGKKVVVPQGLTLAYAKNMYTASIEKKPYAFGTAQLPGFGKPIYVGKATPEPTTPPAEPEPEADVVVPTTSFSAKPGQLQLYGMNLAEININTTDAKIIEQLTAFRDKPYESSTVNGNTTSTVWRYLSQPYQSTNNPTPEFTVSLVKDDGTLLTADYTKQLYFNQVDNSAYGTKFLTFGITSAGFKPSTISKEDLAKLIAKKKFVVSIGGYDYYFKG